MAQLKESKLSKKEESALCLECGECCKKYWITVLPSDAVKISKLLGKTKSKFLDEDCVLDVKIYPKSTPGVLTFQSAMFPKRIIDLLKKELNPIPESFFVVPQVVLKREEKNTFSFFNNKTKIEKRNACVYIDADNSCGIYSARPEPCRQFPFIAMPGFRENYPFCKLFSKTYKDLSIESRIYFKKIQGYFKDVDDKGFNRIWLSPPKRGNFSLGDRELGQLSLNELLEMMSKNKK